VSLGELLTVLSRGVDLGLGQPVEHVLRQCLIARELGGLSGLGEDDLELVTLVTLLAFVGCHADAHEQARWFGDDIALHADIYTADLSPRTEARFVMSRIGAGAPPRERAKTFVDFMRFGRKEMDGMRATHCLIAGALASKLGLRADVGDALQQVFERWDGHGQPGLLEGDQIRLPVRLVNFADVVEVHHREHGVDGAVAMARIRRGTQFDPGVVDLFCEHADAVLSVVDDAPDWDVVILPGSVLSAALPEADCTAALEAFADYADLKSPYTLGHSRAVADLAGEAAHAHGLPPDQVEAIRTAGLVHDLGRLGISNTILDKPGPLTASERERVRMRPYLTERMLSACEALARLAPLAGAAQERLDGSGYPRGLKGDALPVLARILAAADVYQAMLEPRPYREARPPAEAAGELRAEVRAGRLDHDAAECVLRAAGHHTRRRREGPGGLTRREVEVLRLVARGLKSRDIADRLVISRKTVDHHISHIYSKIGASNRVAASLYATEHGLLGPDPD
jgi:HD-GYP domain-containing protein (c-di-GMP phosphodiesterase class II)